MQLTQGWNQTQGFLHFWISDTVPCFPLPWRHILGVGLDCQRDSCSFSICCSTRWQDTSTGTTLHNSFPNSTGRPEQQRIWTTLHFLELKVPQQLWHLSRLSTGGYVNSAQVIKTLFANFKNYQYSTFSMLTCQLDWQLLPCYEQSIITILYKVYGVPLFTGTSEITEKREFQKWQVYQVFPQVYFCHMLLQKTVLSNVATVALYLQNNLHLACTGKWQGINLPFFRENLGTPANS